MNLNVVFDPQALLISLVVIIVFVCGLIFSTIWISSSKQKKAYQEIESVLQKIETQTSPEKLDLNQKVFAVKVFAADLDRYILPRTELPKNNLQNSLVIVEAFIDSKKSNQVVPTQEGTISLEENQILFQGEDFHYRLSLNKLFYLGGFYDLKSKTLLFNFHDYQGQVSLKFQFLYWEDLAIFNQLLYLNKIKTPEGN